jgi:sec-independent protein translocase protein TatC
MATALRPIGHEDRLSLVEHLDELRTRLIICVATLAVAFAVCAWQNHALLNLIGKPLAHTTQKRTLEGKGPLGQIYEAQRGVLQSSRDLQGVLATLTAKGSGLSPAARKALGVEERRLRAAVAQLPKTPPPNKPVTLGVGEPFVTTITVSFYFAVLFALPLILFQLYAFILPAFSPGERRVALPLMAMIPGLFIIGVVFGYLLVLPAATRFLQNFNSDSFNVLVQARDYYKFATLTLLSMGLVFQLPVAVLAVTRLGILTVRQLRQYRRYAIVVNAVIAMALPGTDPVSMLIELVPLLLLYELSILLARWMGGPVPDEEPGDDDAEVGLSSG